MKPSDENSLDEGELYEKIINIFLKEGEKPNIKEIMKSKSIIELMEKLKNNKDKELARNALVVLLSLYDDFPPDLFHNLGTDIEKLSEEDRIEALKKLKESFLNDKNDENNE